MIISFGTYDKDRHPRVAIIIDGLRGHGHDVIELNRPLGFSTAERVRMLKQPWRLPSLAFRLLSRWVSLIRDARQVKRSGTSIDAVLVGYMGHFDVLLARRVFRHSRIVLDHLIFAGDTARDRGSGGTKARLLGWLDRAAISAADIVLVDTAEHANMLPPGATGIVVPVGAREEWFAAAPDAFEPATETLSVVFFGLYTPLQGAGHMAEGIAAALDRGARLTATLVGTGQDWEAARAKLGARTEITWIDWVDPASLPALVAAHDVSLGIFGASQKALRVVPNKVYESAAAGCCIITSDTAPQREMLGADALLVAPGDAQAVADVLIELANDPEERRRLRESARRRSESFRAVRIVEPLLPLLSDAA